MKLGILGTGTIVQELLPQLEAVGVEKAYLLSTPRSAERARTMAEEYGLDGVFFDYDTLLASDIDTVYVALPNHLHFEYTRRALSADKHVILEKPAVTRKAELEELAALAGERRRFLIEAVPLRHRAGYLALRNAIGKIGKPRLASCYYCQRSRRYDDFLRGEIHPVFDPAKAGGALMDLNLYNIHALVGLFGAPQQADYHANVTRGIDTSGLLTLAYRDFQAAALGAKDCPAPDLSAFLGEEGYLQIDLRRLDGYTFTPRNGERERVDCPCEEHRLLTEFRDLKRIIEENDTAEGERLMADSLIVAEILETARKKAGIVFPDDETEKPWNGR